MRERAPGPARESRSAGRAPRRRRPAGPGLPRAAGAPPPAARRAASGSAYERVDRRRLGRRGLAARVAARGLPDRQTRRRRPADDQATPSSHEPRRSMPPAAGGDAGHPHLRRGTREPGFMQRSRLLEVPGKHPVADEGAERARPRDADVEVRPGAELARPRSAGNPTVLRARFTWRRAARAAADLDPRALRARARSGPRARSPWRVAHGPQRRVHLGPARAAVVRPRCPSGGRSGRPSSSTPSPSVSARKSNRNSSGAAGAFRRRRSGRCRRRRRAPRTKNASVVLRGRVAALRGREVRPPGPAVERHATVRTVS